MSLYSSRPSPQSYISFPSQPLQVIICTDTEGTPRARECAGCLLDIVLWEPHRTHDIGVTICYMTDEGMESERLSAVIRITCVINSKHDTLPKRKLLPALLMSSYQYPQHPTLFCQPAQDPRD